MLSTHTYRALFPSLSPPLLSPSPSSLQGAGNETFLTTGGKLSASSCFVNRLVAQVSGLSAMSLTVIFGGINANKSSPLDFLPPDLKLYQLFSPPLGDTYVLPDLTAISDLGDITALAIGGNPSATEFANLMSLHFASVDGKVKVEVNGGGLNANYSVSSGFASAVVEIDGKAAPLTGVLGSGSSNLNEVILRSEKDDVQLALLPSAL